jgi:hypothetical protein
MSSSNLRQRDDSAFREQWMSDESLEISIDLAHRRWLAAPSIDEQLAGWRKLCDLINRRSPAQIQRMESKKGLQRGGRNF